MNQIPVFFAIDLITSEVDRRNEKDEKQKRILMNQNQMMMLQLYQFDRDMAEKVYYAIENYIKYNEDLERWEYRSM